MTTEPEHVREGTEAMAEDDRPLTLPETPRALRRRVLGLAWPVIGENMLETSLDIINTILVAALGAAALAGVGSGPAVAICDAVWARSIASSLHGPRSLFPPDRLTRRSSVRAGVD